MRLAWVTDPHLGSCSAGTLRTAMRARGSVDAAVCTGDISEAPDLRRHLGQLRDALGCPVYFVLGNHDYYKGSFASVAQSLTHPVDRTTWLRTSPPVELAPGVVLTGHDGFYDARAGSPTTTSVLLNDFLSIADLRSVARLEPFVEFTGKGYRMGQRMTGRAALIEYLQELADTWAHEALQQLDQALALSPKRVLFATHIPPFPEACWHKGELSDGQWQPWFVNTALGAALSIVAEENRDVEFTVLCGHTHSPGRYQHAANMVVLTGASDYGSPVLSDVLDL